MSGPKHTLNDWAGLYASETYCEGETFFGTPQLRDMQVFRSIQACPSKTGVTAPITELLD